MRLAIADDEALVRSFVRSLALEAFPELQVVEASNGVELVAALSSGKADAAFVDIRMPKLDGFEALASLRNSGYRPPWFVLSSHSDFSYAKRALELGALGYVLKPPSPQEIRAALTQLSEAVAHERAELRSRFARDWALYAAGHTETPPDLGGDYRYSVALILLDLSPGCVRIDRNARAVVAALSERAERYAESGLVAAIIPAGETGVLAAISGYPVSRPETAAVAKQFWNEASPAAESAGEGLSALTLVSGTESSVSSLRDQLTDLRSVAARRALLPGGTLSFERAASLLSVASPADVAYAEKAAVLASVLSGGDAMAARSAVRDCIAASSGHRGVVRFLERLLGADGGSAEESVLFAACERARDPSAGAAPERDTIASVQEYIRRRYAEGVSVDEAALVFGLTPNYLSSLFHKRVGATFVQYLTEVRLLKALDLLRAGRSVKETARDVGYGSERHFSRLFRERFGHAPAFERRKSRKS